MIIFNFIEDVLDDMFNTHWHRLLLTEYYWLFARCLLFKTMDVRIKYLLRIYINMPS